MTVTEAARRLEVGRPALSNFLNGKAALSQQMARKLGQTFGVDVAALLDRQACYAADAEFQRRHPRGGPFAPSVTTIRAADIEEWANRIEARQQLAVLLRKLVHGTGGALSRVDFPGYDSAERRGWDGWVEASAPAAWIPDGDSGWEFGCSRNPGKKANQDFDTRGIAPDAEKEQLTFVFVTPRGWAGKRDWQSAKRRLGLWKDVRAYDADDLEQWIEQCVPAQVWFAEQLGRPVIGFVSLDEYWRQWAGAADPRLPGALFQTAVEEHSDAFRKWLENPRGRPFTIAADSRAEAIAMVARLMDHAGDDHEYCHRGIVFESPEAVQRVASSSPGAFVAVAATPAAARAFPAFAKAVHCVVPVPRHGVWSKEQEPDVTLGPLGQMEFLAALSTVGLSHDDVVRLSRDSGRSPTVLQRCLSTLPEVSRPPWARANEAQILGPLSLIGAWNTASEGDREVVRLLSNTDHEAVEAFVAEAARFDDPPIWSVGEYRGVVSRLDSFFATVSFWTPDLVRRFFRIAGDVLAERDPALDLPEDERWMAALHGKNRAHSSALRKGLRETLVILAVHGFRHLDQRLGLKVRESVETVVGELLRPLDLDRLRSCDADLPDLAEAAPEVFLATVEADLDSGESAVMALMRPADSNLLTGGCPRAGLLWALERLAWQPGHYPRVVEILARLSAVEIGDNWAHKPDYSLAALFDPHHPQTKAPLAVRLRTLGVLAQRHPEVGWSVALGQKWHPHVGLAHRSERPAWRGDASAYRNSVSSDDAERFIRAARETCLDWPQHNRHTLAGLVRIFPQLEPEHRRRVVRLIAAWEAAAPSQNDRATLADRVRGMRRLLKSRHPALRTELTAILEQLEQNDFAAGVRWLFASEWGPVHEAAAELGDDEEAERVIDERRLGALRRIYEEDGASGIESLLTTADGHHVVGRLLSDVVRTPSETEALVARCLNERGATKASAMEDLLRAFMWKIELSKIDSLWHKIVVCDDARKQQRFLRCLPYKQAARVLEGSPGDIRSTYWRDFKPNQYYSDAEKNELIDRLLEAERPSVAFSVVPAGWDKIHSSRLVRLLRSVGETENSSEEQQMDGQSLGWALESLAQRPDVSDEEKAGLELKFFESLRFGPHPMHSLARRMAASPDIFVEAVARCFGRTDDRVDPPPLRSARGESRRAVARKAFDVLEWFSSLPGADDSGSIEIDTLNKWIGEARSMFRDLGRVEIGDERIGRLLTTAGPDPSGVWPRREICVALEDNATADLRIGFVTGSLARRGVWTRSPEEGGIQERDLAARYRSWATLAASEFPCVERALREVAEWYEQQAEEMDTRGELQRRGVG